MEWEDTVNVTLRPSGWLCWVLHNWRLGLRKMPASIHPPVRPSHSTQVTSNRSTAETMPARSSARRCRKTQNTSYSACVKARKITQPGSKSPANKTSPGLWIKCDKNCDLLRLILGIYRVRGENRILDCSDSENKRETLWFYKQAVTHWNVKREGTGWGAHLLNCLVGSFRFCKVWRPVAQLKSAKHC